MTYEFRMIVAALSGLWIRKQDYDAGKGLLDIDKAASRGIKYLEWIEALLNE